MARGRGRRTDYSWGTIADVQLAVDPGSAALFMGSTGSFIAPGTVMRLRGRVCAGMDGGGADESIGVMVGVGVFDVDQIVAGAAPEFTTDGSNDEFNWIWVGMLWLWSGNAGAAEDGSGQFDRLEIDSKAMRKVKPNEQIAIVLEAPAPLATDQTGTVDVTAFVRILTGE